LHRRNEEFSRKNTQCRQLALACHFIEKFGIRVGNEKNTVLAADTVGCCTLKKNVHIRIVDSEKRLVKMDFHGKDDVHFKKKSTMLSRP
jgi:DNA topoisomerase IB